MSSYAITDNSNRIIRNTFAANVGVFIVNSMTSSVGALIDGVVIGQFLGLDSVAAFGLVSPVIIVFSLIGAVLASGSRNRFTLMIGQGDLEGARGVFSLSVIISGGLSTLLMLLVLLFSNPLCVLLGATGDAAGLLDKTRGYLTGLAFGLPAMNLSRVLGNYLCIDNDRRLTVIATLVLTLVDIVLDVLIAVSGGEPPSSQTPDERQPRNGMDHRSGSIRDDCEIFDPLKQLQLFDNNVPMHHIGLRLAISSAKDVQYTTMLGLNNLVLRV